MNMLKHAWESSSWINVSTNCLSNSALNNCSCISTCRKIRFGRMERRMIETRAESMVAALEHAGDRPVPEKLARNLRREADELNLVRSGLDDTMRNAFQEMDQVWRSRDDVPDLRTAAYIIAIDKVAKYYTEYLLS